jgi:hypothetical protein
MVPMGRGGRGHSSLRSWCLTATSRVVLRAAATGARALPQLRRPGVPLPEVVRHRLLTNTFECGQRGPCRSLRGSPRRQESGPPLPEPLRLQGPLGQRQGTVGVRARERYAIQNPIEDPPRAYTSPAGVRPGDCPDTRSGARQPGKPITRPASAVSPSDSSSLQPASRSVTNVRPSGEATRMLRGFR